MDQHISVMILKIILVMTYDYKKSCNASQIIYRGCLLWVFDMIEFTCIKEETCTNRERYREKPEIRGLC